MMHHAPDVSRGLRQRAAVVRRPIAPPQADQVAKLTREIASRDWYIARPMPRADGLAVRLLADCGVVAFSPEVGTWVRRSRHARARTLRYVPATPGYILVGVEQGGSLDPVYRCRAIHGVLGNQGQPARLVTRPDDPDRCPVVWMLRRSDAAPSLARLVADQRGIETGHSVRVATLPGATARVVEIGEDRIALAVTMFNREVALFAEPEDVSPV